MVRPVPGSQAHCYGKLKRKDQLGGGAMDNPPFTLSQHGKVGWHIGLRLIVRISPQAENTTNKSSEKSNIVTLVALGQFVIKTANCPRNA